MKRTSRGVTKPGMEKRQTKAEELFGEALDMPREQRVAFLERHAAECPRCGAQWKACSRRMTG